MRFSTALALAALLLLLAQSPELAGFVDQLLANVVWLLTQPPVLAVLLVAVVVHRVRARWV